MIGEIEVRDEGELVAKGQRAGEADCMRPEVAGRVEDVAREEALRVAGQHARLERRPLREEALPALRHAIVEMAAAQQALALIVRPQQRHPVQRVSGGQHVQIRLELRRFALAELGQ